MTSFLELAKRRFSSRKYLSKPVEEVKLLKVLESARIAPSAANKQPWIFYVIQNDGKRSQIAEAYHRDWLKAAPVIIVACANHQNAWIRSDNKDHCDIDLAIAIDHMTLQATELGLSTCWICNFDPVKCREILKLDDFVEPIAILPLAYPANLPDTDRHAENRKKLNEIVRWEF
jgi:nitroreductase